MNLKTQPENEAAAFNSRFIVGAPVRYYSVRGVAKFLITRTRTHAHALSGHTAVVFLENVSGCVAVSHVEPARPEDLKQLDPADHSPRPKVNA